MLTISQAIRLGIEFNAKAFRDPWQSTEEYDCLRRRSIELYSMGIKDTFPIEIVFVDSFDTNIENNYVFDDGSNPF